MSYDELYKSLNELKQQYFAAKYGSEERHVLLLQIGKVRKDMLGIEKQISIYHKPIGNYKSEL